VKHAVVCRASKMLSARSARTHTEQVRASECAADVAQQTPGAAHPLPGTFPPPTST